jgi:hypothetical protein
MIHEQTDPANIWLVQHSLNSISPVVTTWLTTSGGVEMVIPREVSVIDEDNLRVIFTQPQTGAAVVNI